MVKNFGKSQPIRQNFFANIHDEKHDHTICIAERTCKLNTLLTNYVYT